MRNEKTKRMVGLAILMAIVVVLQLLGQFIRFGPVSITLVLVPIVVGAAMYGPAAGALLGAAFSLVVLMQADTMFFYNISVVGTIVTVLAKGTVAGWLAGLIYRSLAKKNIILAAFLAAAVCPLVNTALFTVGARLFFWEELKEGGGTTWYYFFTVVIGLNFVAEFVTNMICGPVIVRVIQSVQKAK